VRLTSTVRAVFGLEMRSLLRDPRTLLVSVVLPVLLIPAILMAGDWMQGRRAERERARTYRFAVVGTDSAFVLDLVAAISEDTPGPGDPAYAPDPAGTPGSAGTGDSPESGVRFRRVPVTDPRAALESDSVDFYVEGLTRGEWLAGLPDTAEAGVGPEDGGARVVRIHYLAPRTGSREGAAVLRDHLLKTRQSRRDSIVTEAGFPVSPEQVATVNRLNIASDEEVQSARLGRFLTMILVGLMLLGGSAVATDTLAGEKERGTLETLLTSAASRGEIIWGKLLSIMAVALAIALIQVVNLWIFLGLGLLDVGGGSAVAVTPAVAFVLLVLYLPVVALTAGLLLLVSAHARTYKEAQLYLSPVLLGMLLPTLAPFLPDLSLGSAIVVVPIANLSLAARDLLIGEIHPPLFGAAWIVTAAAAAWVVARSVRALHDENLVTGGTTRAEFLGGPELFPRRVLRWFLVFWAVKILLDFNLPFDDIRVAVLFSVGVVFLAFPLLVIRHFRLDPAEALALRMPRPGVWLGVALGVPAALVAVTTLFRLVDFVLPMPTEVVENFGQALLPEDVPAWQLILLLSVIPGITEEMTFRGVLLHGLRRRFGPVALALVVGLIFGIFHFQLFRIPVTAALGVLLAAVTLLTGSIFPAMVWHATNNALGVFLGTRGIEMEFESWWWGLAAILVLVLAFRIIWAYRTPYPEVGARRKRRSEDWW
jgi:sodium transport system permease protein